MKELWGDLKAFWGVLFLRGTAKQAWRLVTISLIRPGSFDGAKGIEVGAQVFPPGSKWMSAGWCLPCSENCGRLEGATTTDSSASIVRWTFNLAPDITGMER